MRLIFTTLLLLISILSAHPALDSLNTSEQLDSIASFSFIAIGDNEGDSPLNRTEFAKMAAWTEHSQPVFFIGLGDHVKKGRDNDFLEYCREKSHWDFYPGIGGGENEYYGSTPDDCCVGQSFLKYFGLLERKNVMMSEAGCEYYARIDCPDSFAVHLIQLHPCPTDLHDRTEPFLIHTLKSIPYGKRDIVIISSHSTDTNWTSALLESTKDLIETRVALFFNASDHFFRSISLPSSGPLILNPGSITHPESYSPPGYIEVHVLTEPEVLIVQYINTATIERELQNSDYAFIKYLKGEADTLHLREKRPSEDFDRIIGHLDHCRSADTLAAIIEKQMSLITGAVKAYTICESGLTCEVCAKDLWNVFPRDNMISVINLAPEEYELIFHRSAGTKSVSVALSSQLAEYLSAEFNLGTPESTVFTEHDILMQIIQGR